MLTSMWSKISRRGRRCGGARTTQPLRTAALTPLAAATIVITNPAWFGLSTTPIVLHALSFRGVTAIGLAGTGAALLWPRSGQPHRAGSWQRLGAGGLLLAAGLGQAAILEHRGWRTPTRAGRADLAVVTLNTLGGAATAAQIADLVAGELKSADAAIIALPETSEAQARHTADLLAAAGHRFQVFSTTENAANPLSTTSLLVSEELGVYHQLSTPRMLLGAVLAKPVSGSGPTLAAVHPGAPMPKVGYRQWRSYVTAAVDIARTNENSIVAGDFNTTVDHQMMRDLRPSFDAALRAGRGAEGTWPAYLPPVLSAPIDHVLVNGPFSVLGTRTVRVGRSDHRAVIARLTGVDR